MTIVLRLPASLCCDQKVIGGTVDKKESKGNTDTLDPITQVIFPNVDIGWSFRDEYKICTTTVKEKCKSQQSIRAETHATPANNASQPQSLPMTSTTKALEWLYAVELMLSMASQMRWRAVGAPMVRSVMDMSLSMEPTSPTSLRCECRESWSSVMRSGFLGSWS